MAVNIGPKIGIDGEKEYRDQLKAIIEQSKLLKTEMDLLKSSFDDEGKSLKENSEKRKLLNEQIENQKDRVEALADMLEKSKSKYGENAVETKKWQEALNTAQADLNEMNRELENLPSNLELVGQKMESIGNKISEVGKGMSDFGAKMTRNVTTPIVGAFGAAIKESVDFESAFTGVMKTVDASPEKYKELEQAVKDLASSTTSSKEAIAGVMEAAGQLGVAADDVTGFTKTMVMLGDTTNLSAEEAATALARFTNITGSGNANVDRLGSTIVALGNNFATTEAEIVEMSTRLASAGSIAGMSETDILALSAAMSSVGIQAEAGGTAMTQTLKTISNAVFDFKDGFTEDLETIAGVAGTTAEEFAATWEANPVDALQKFIVGLAGIKEEGSNVFAVLEDMGMKGVRQSNMLQSLALASDTLAGAVNMASEAYKENTALSEEASKRYATMEAQFHMLKESVSNLALSFGEQLMPYVQKGIDFFQGLVEKFSALDEEDKELIIKIAATAAAIGPLLTIGGKLTQGIGFLISTGGKLVQFLPTVVTGLGTVATFVTGTMVPAITGFITAAAGIVAPFLPFILIAGAVVAAGVLIYKNWDEICEWAGKLGEKIQEVWGNIKEWAEDLKDKVVEKWEGIRSGVSEKWENMKTAASEKWTNIKETVNGTLDNVKKHASERLGNIKTAFEENGGGIKGIVAAGWTAIKDNYKEGFNILNTLTDGKLGEIWNKFSEKFTNLKENALNWGKDIIKNIADGITAGIQWVKDAVTSVGETIRDFLHFSEPDKGPLSNFNTWMPDMMNQMAQQIEAGRARVQMAISGVAGDIASPTANNTTMNYGGTTINVYGAQGQDVNELADIVMSRIDAEITKKEAVFA